MIYALLTELRLIPILLAALLSLLNIFDAGVPWLVIALVVLVPPIFIPVSLFVFAVIVYYWAFYFK